MSSIINNIQLGTLYSSTSISTARTIENTNFSELYGGIVDIVESLGIDAGSNLNVLSVKTETLLVTSSIALNNGNLQKFSVNTNGEISATSLYAPLAHTSRIRLDPDPTIYALQAGEIRWSGSDFLGWNGFVWLSLTGGIGLGTITGATNIGGYAGLYSSLVGTDLQFRSVKAGTNVTIDNTNSDYIIVSSTAVGTSGFSGFSGQSTSGFSGKSGASTSGYSGLSGFSGLSGYSGMGGFSGSSGFSGISGRAGLNGPAGAQGTSGFSGFSGNSGWSGYSGFSGISGWSGGQGITGATGPAGTSGYSGASGSGGGGGASGISGYSGASTSGFSGISGFSGLSGTGPAGTSGYSGSGISGYSGYVGVAGPMGFSGISGYSGTGPSAPIYPLNLIPYGDGMTPGGVTSFGLEYIASSATFLVGVSGVTGGVLRAGVPGGDHAFGAGDLDFTHNNTVLLLDDAASSITMNATDVTINNGHLNVNGLNYSWPGSEPAASSYLTNDGTGTLAWTPWWVVASINATGLTSTAPTLLVYTVGAANSTFLVSAYANIFGDIGSTITMTVAFTNEGGAPGLSSFYNMGASSPAEDFYNSNYPPTYISCQAGSTVTVACTISGPITYDAGAAIIKIT